MAGFNVLEASEEKSNGTKILRLLIDGGTYVSRKYFDSFHPPGKLPQIISREKKKLEEAKKKRFIRDDQWKKLFPSDGSPNFEEFDITLWHFLIREIYLADEIDGSTWNTMPKESDQSPLANLIRIRCFRNEINHSGSTAIPNDAFEDMWAKISSALVALSLDKTEIDRLKNEPIDHRTLERVKEDNELWKLAQELNGRLENVEKRLENVEGDAQQLKERFSKIQFSEPRIESEPDSYLPDEVAGVFGRDKQIKQVIEVIRQEATVVITGGPGFGKTTVATKAAYKLKQEHRRRLLFCDLTSTKKSHDVANLMLGKCSNHTSIDNPQHWLFNFLIRKVCPTTDGDQASLILCELIDRSLVEKPSSQIYQVHSLIQAFSRKFSRENYPNLLTEGEKLACAHFISRIDNNAKQYWRKDTCKAAIDSFSDERHNFEHFLQVYIRGIQNQEHTTGEICETFFDDFLQKCMYLEKCLQPSFYIQILESLLTSPEPEIQQPVKRVELLCLLGHEMRKKGEKSKYTDCMEKAKQLFSENEHEFKTQALSEVFYRQSYARYLSEGNGKGPNMEYKTALRICEEKYPDHPETAATLLFAGRYARRCHKYCDVIDKYNRALDIFETQLGHHLMTAQCYKDIADFLFASDETESYLDVTLVYYQMAFDMMRELKTDDQKESILMLKNYGKCQIKNGNFEEGEKLLLKAEGVAERELEENHRWKVLVKTELAVFYKRAFRIQEMEEALKKGLEMHYKIAKKRTLDGLVNKREISELLNCYPKLFPQEEYPRA